MSYSNPIFPLEIFSQVIEKVVESPEPLHIRNLSEEQRATLDACSLTCKFLFHLSRPEKFRNVSILFYGGGGEALLRLMDILEAKPHLKSYIKGVRIQLFTVHPTEEPFQKLKNHAEHPSMFPAVESISITDDFIFTAGGRPMSRPAHIPGWILDFCQDVIKSYIALPTLRSLCIKDDSRSTNLSLLALQCPAITELQLDQVFHDGEEEVTRFEHLRRLTIGNCAPRLYSLITTSPALSDLTLWGEDILELEGEVSLPVPIGRLQRLKIAPAECLSESFDIFWRTSHLGFKPITWVEEFSVVIGVFRDFSIADRMFDDLHQLRSLEITILFPLYKPSSFGRFHLDKHLATSFPALARMTISILDHPRSLAIPFLLETLPSISMAKHLKYFEVKISTTVRVEDTPQGNLNQTLYDDTLFPSLSKVISTSLTIESVEELKIVLEFDARSNQDNTDKRVLKDDPFRSRIEAEIQDLEATNGIVMSLHFTPCVIKKAHSMSPRLISRCAVLALYRDPQCLKRSR